MHFLNTITIILRSLILESLSDDYNSQLGKLSMRILVDLFYAVLFIWLWLDRQK